MELFIKFVTDNSDKIWTLISVSIGGLVTYFTTSAAEIHKSKIQSQKDNLDHILIPYCTCLEKTIFQIKQIYQENVQSFTINSFDTQINILYDPLIYLEAAKRVYLPQSIRCMLENLKTDVDSFLFNIELDCNNIIKEHNAFFSALIRKYLGLPLSNTVYLVYNENTNSKIKPAIINKFNISLLSNITKVNFFENNSDMKFRSIDLSDDVRNEWYILNCKVSPCTSSNRDLSFRLLDFLEKYKEKESSIINPIIDNSFSGLMLSNIIDELDNMQKKLIKTIDKIAK